uniref:F-box domain-containing protein n=1 Tax=Parascaris univalens TaxID=6257 RepID=A0A915AGA9_PARUN
MRMTSSLKKTDHKMSINDLPAEILLMIFQRCHPVSCYRARAVCRRWRTAIDEMDEDSRVAVVGDGHARLFICDRRRAILEKFACLPSCSSSVHDLISTRKSTFYEDRYAHTALSNWAYRFDLSEWSRNFDIVEVWLQNFGSFLERDQSVFGDSPLYLPSISSNGNSGGPNKSGSYAATTPTQTTPSRQMGRSPHSHRSGGSSGSLSIPGVVPYNLLPSSQQASTESICGPVELTEEMRMELTELSGGRFERLAAQLRNVQPLHVVFNDHSFYQKRPTLLLFWFLKQLPNLRKLTLDCIQGDQEIELHRVFSVEGIDELTIIQPQQKACVIANEGILDAFLDVNRSERRRFRIRFSGKTHINAHAMCSFIKKWQNHREVIPFQSILVDALSVRPSDFVRAAMCFGDTNNNNEVHKDKEENSSLLNAKQLMFVHRRSDVRIKYKYEDGYLMFTYFDPKDRRRRVAPYSPPVHRVVSFYSPLPLGNNNTHSYEKRLNGADVKTIHSKGGSKSVGEEETMLKRLFAMILRSAA